MKERRSIIGAGPRASLVLGIGIISLLLASTTAAARQPDASTPCAFRTDPHVVESRESHFLQFWLEPDRSVLGRQTLPAAASLHRFREEVAESFPTDPIVLLDNLFLQIDGADAENNRIASAGEAGSIRPIDCLEALLFAAQADRGVQQGHSMFSAPTEFLSFVLRKEGMLKIWFYTVDQPGIGGVSIFDDLLDADREDGWEVVRNIHNHNFFPDGDLLLGGIAPSAGDVQALRAATRRFGLPAASITNGFHTLDMTPADLESFRTPD
jgi:hypothetical protein